jgi:hypothetical protein
MSFKCDVCKKPQNNGVKGTKIVTEVRNVAYPPVRKKDGKIVTPTGFETVKEVYACPNCSKKDFDVVVVDSKVVKDKNDKEIRHEEI